MKKIIITTMTISILCSLTIDTKPTVAGGCGFLDITCNPGNWDKPPGGDTIWEHKPQEDTGSCVQVVSPPVIRKFSITNGGSSPVKFTVSNNNESYQRTLQPNRTLNFKNWKVSSGTNNSCQDRTVYGAPIVTFDESYREGFQKTTYTIKKNGDYYFNNDEERISISDILVASIDLG